MIKILYVGLGIFVIFLILALIGQGLNNKSSYVIRDGKVYFSGAHLMELKGADPESFEAIPKSSYAKDKNRVYHASHVVDGADPESFELLPHRDYAKDKNHVFYWHKIVKGPIGSSFQILPDPWKNSSRYGRDENHIYLFSVYGGEKMDVLDEADLSTFEVLLSKSLYPGASTGKQYLEYARDSKFVYSLGSVVPGADSGTFEILKTPSGGPSIYARDRSNVYNLIERRVLDLDRESFEVLSEEKARDKNREFSAFTK